MAPVAGVRHIWQDEAETAERARAILAFGVPRVVDPEGRPSLNAGGREIEEGTLHRYTPWGQFYIGAAGLAVGRSIGLSDDASLRLPFVFLHSASSTLLSYTLTTAVAWPVTASVAASTLFGLQSVRILNNRSARYHAGLDFFFILGLLAIALRQKGSSLLALSTFLLPQIHTLGGAVLSSTLVLIALLVALIEERSFWKALRRELWCAMVPAAMSVVLICVLCRPWLQTAWISQDIERSRYSLKPTLEIAYSYYLFALALIFLIWKRQWREVAILVPVVIYIFAVVKVLDLNPFSQPRYYLAIPIFFLFWPIVTGWPKVFEARKALFIGLMTFGVVLPDVQGIIPAWQGVRIVLNDYHLGEQPLRQAIKEIESAPTEPVLADYVPQFVNWYLRETPVAMMPRSIELTRLNRDNPLFKAKRIEPGWHLFYKKQDGLWVCYPHCDYHRSFIGETEYDLIVDADATNAAETIRFCIVKTWPTDIWNNAPFTQYNSEAMNPEGFVSDILVLARRCAK
jgi:hypothetical protein